MANQMALVDCDTWQGLYVNDELVWQGHTISLRDASKFILHHVFDDFRVYEADLDWMDAQSYLPAKLQEVRVLRMGQSITIQELWETE
jgi:hypothetical protein